MQSHPEETPKAHAAWQIYRDLGPRRTLAKLVEVLGRRPSYMSTVKGWSARYDWQARAAAHDHAALRDGLGERAYMRERALQDLVECADEASRVVMAILRDRQTIGVMDRDGNEVGRRPVVSPSVKLEAAKWIHGVVGIVPVKRMELQTEPDSLTDQADAILNEATAEQLEAVIEIFRKIEGTGDGGADAPD